MSPCASWLAERCGRDQDAWAEKDRPPASLRARPSGQDKCSMDALVVAGRSSKSTSANHCIDFHKDVVEEM